MKYVVSILLLLNLTLPASAEIYAVDGDTLEINGERVRILDIDTPEVTYAKCGREKIAGFRAAIALQELLETGKPITLQRHGTDKYDRTLAHVFVGDISVSDYMLQSGHARPYGGGSKSWCE